MRVEHLDEKMSDHLPIMLRTKQASNTRQGHRQRRLLENMWVSDDCCEQVITKAWSTNSQGEGASACVAKTKRCMDALQRWNVDVFGNVQKAMARIEEKIKAA